MNAILREGMGRNVLLNVGGVKRSLIFNNKMRKGRRCRAQMLNLPVRREPNREKQRPSTSKGCEVCGRDDVPLDKAHWVPESKGGYSRPYNILRLCPNCHRSLDRGDKNIEYKTRCVLLFRETRKLLEPPLADSEKKLSYCLL